MLFDDSLFYSKAKPGESRRRKAADLSQMAGLPDSGVEGSDVFFVRSFRLLLSSKLKFTAARETGPKL